MPELTHDASEDGFHEIQLSGKQLVFLFMSTTVVLVVTFLCGVLVGRNVKTDRETERPAETVAVQSDGDEGELPPPPTGEAPPADTQFKYPTSLTEQNPKVELAPEKKNPAPVPPPERAAPPAETKPPAPAAKPPAAQNTATSTTAGVPTTGRPGTWFLQVLALRNREAAADTVRQLIAKGYPAYLADPPAGQPLYRVRIGRYGTRDEAAQVAQRLQKEGQFKSDIRRY